jgi:hypothetical protein
LATARIFGVKKEMLKLIYTEDSLLLEVINQPLEDWVMTRVILGLRTAESVHLEPTTASFLLSAHLPNLSGLKQEVQALNSDLIAVDLADNDTVEVILNGSWLSGADENQGIFVTSLPYKLEFYLWKLWQESVIVQTSAVI